MSEQPKSSAENPNEGAPPRYEHDPAWTKERENRMHQLFNDIGSEKLPLQESIEQLSVLIDEAKEAIRDNPESHPGMDIIQTSPMLQGLLDSFYILSRKLASEKGK